MNLAYLIAVLILSILVFNYALKKLPENSGFIAFVNSISQTTWTTLDIVGILLTYIVFYETELLEQFWSGGAYMTAIGLYIAVLNLKRG